MKTKTKNNIFSRPLSLIVAMLIVPLLAAPLINLGHAKAATPPFTVAFVRLDSLNATTSTSGRVCLQPSSAASPTINVVVTFPTTSGTDYTVNQTAGNWALNTTGLDIGETAMPNLPATVSSVSGKTITVTLSSSFTLLTSNLYCFNWTGSNTLTTSSANAAETSQGNIETNAAGPTPIDQTTFAESIITNDQVVVSAVVPPSFTFQLNGNTDSFTQNLSTTSAVSTSGRNVTLITNANSGWIVWAEDLNNKGGQGALQSATDGNYKIAGINGNSPGTNSAVPTAGSENYGLGVTINTNTSGSVSLNPAYDGTSGKAGTLDPSAFLPIASNTGTTNGDIISLNERATVAGQTPAGSDYTDTITLIGAGQF